MAFGLGVNKREEQTSPTWRHKESVDGGWGVQLEGRLKSGWRAP